MPTHDGERTPPNEAHAEALAFLQDWMVLAADPTAQRKLATKLAQQTGFDESAIVILDAYFRDQEKKVDDIGGIAYSLLSSKAKLDNFMISARKWYDRRTSDVEPHQRNEMVPEEVTDPEWLTQDRQRKAWCLIAYDKKDPTYVAAYLGVEVEEIGKLAFHGGLLGGGQAQDVASRVHACMAAHELAANFDKKIAEMLGAGEPDEPEEGAA